MTSKTIKAKIRSSNGSVTTSRVKKNVEKNYKTEMIKQQTDPRHNQSAFKGGR
tara:strand:+ start:676 stop:834 length:159 start_codon:yes stop_codon:yes gene_type:complete